MSSSREESPDWLRSFQPPTQSAIDLSSGSESSLDHRPVSDDEDGINLSKLFNKETTKASDKEVNDGSEAVFNKLNKGKSTKKNEEEKQTPKGKRTNEDGSKKPGKKAKRQDASKGNRSEKHEKSHEEKRSIWSLSSDSESSPNTKLAKMDSDMEIGDEVLVAEDKKEIDDISLEHDRELPRDHPSEVKCSLRKLEKMDDDMSIKKATNCSTNAENDSNHDIGKGDLHRKHFGPQTQVSSSSVPLFLPEKVQRSKALIECDGDSIDLSGDVGVVGRIVISEDSINNPEMLLDLKGTIYKTTIVPSRTFCVVSFGQSEAKIEAIMNDYVQLKPQSNVYEAETMVEGTLDGFSFDSEDEADKATVQANQNVAADEQPDAENTKKPRKAAGALRRNGKPAGGKPTKKVKKKPQVSKKGKSKK